MDAMNLVTRVFAYAAILLCYYISKFEKKSKVQRREKKGSTVQYY